MAIYVIGSGPAGVAAASALLERGLAVIMLDVGLELEADKKKLLEQFKLDKNIAKLSSLKHKLNSKNPIKLSYGSDFPYAGVSTHFHINADEHIDCLPSFAKGGLSNLWGAFVEKYQDIDLTHWPIQLTQLVPYYETIFKLISVSNIAQSSIQADKLFARLQNNKQTLHQIGINFGKPFLAAKFNDCIYCGSCQYGCPLELIYSSAQTLDVLLSNPKFRYINNMIVQAVNEEDNQVNITAIHRLTGEQVQLKASQVFLACGPIISTYLMMENKKDQEQVVQFQDSTHFMFPCFMRDSVKGVTKEKLHTLCQLYLKIKHPDVSAKTINLQIYTFMDYYAEKLNQMFKGFGKLFFPLLKLILNHLVIIQGHLDSEESHRFNLELSKVNPREIKLTSIINPATKQILKKLMSYLKKYNQLTGLIPIPFMLQISKICKSFHYGASMPMKLNPVGIETDIYGKPAGLKRIHVVDASIFPSIPAGSITPTIMANAYRIAKESHLYE